MGLPSAPPRGRPRIRFWVEAGLAFASLVFLLFTLLVPDWIEAIFGVEPDEGSGELEWAIVLLLLAVTITASVLARIEWRRPSVPAQAPGGR